MRAYIIGYNLKHNIGDDLMLNSNIKFAKRFGCNEVVVVEWSKRILFKYTAVDYAGESFLKAEGRFHFLGVVIFFHSLFSKSIFIFGGGNLFDSQVMGRRLFLLALILRLFGAFVYLRGIGVGVERWFTKYLKTFRCRSRDGVICKKNGVTHNDTAYWAINTKLRWNAREMNCGKKYDFIVFPRDLGDLGNVEQIDILFEYLKHSKKICFYSMDVRKRKSELEMINKLVSRLECTNDKSFDIKLYSEYKHVVEDMMISDVCIAARLHAGIIWEKIKVGRLIVMPYSKKHLYEFSGGNVEFTPMLLNEGG